MAKRTYAKENGRLYRYTAGGNFYCRVGKTELCLETANLEEALDSLNVQDERTRRYGMRAFNRRVGKLFPQFLKKKKGDVRPRTYDLYEGIWLKHFEKFFGKMLLADVTQKKWTRFCEQAHDVSDFQNHRNLIHAFLKWCMREEHLTAIPTFENPDHKRRRRKVIPPQHLAMIFQRSHGSLLQFVALALFMGMRRSEIMALEWMRVDLVNRTLTLRDEDVKTNDGRQIPITDVVNALLVMRLKEQQDAGIRSRYVFPHADSPKRPADRQGLMGAWRRCLLHCGLAEKVMTVGRKSKYKIVVQYTWHDLRATYEKHSHMSKDHTDTQKEKMVGADIDVQKRLYVSMGADDLRGLEEVVSNQVPELARIVSAKTGVQKVQGGKPVGNLPRITSGASSND